MKKIFTILILFSAFVANAQHSLFRANNNYMAPVIPFQAPEIITSGLVLNLDAGNPASYSGSGTTWTDLSGNGNNGTLVNSPTYNASNQGYLSFNGSNTYVDLPASSSSFNVGSGDFTIETWVYPETADQYGHLFTLNGDGNNDAAVRLAMMKYTGQRGLTYLHSYGSGWAVAVNSSPILAINAWSQIVMSRINGIVKLYVNNIEKVSYSLTGALKSPVNSNTRIGSLPSSSNSIFFFKGNIAISRLYKGKGLTPAEVTNNFNAVKSRFSL